MKVENADDEQVVLGLYSTLRRWIDRPRKC